MVMSFVEGAAKHHMPTQTSSSPVMSHEHYKAIGQNEPDVEVPVGDAAKGARIFKAKCAACHTVTSTGPNKTGPNLHGLFGRPAASKEGYEYVEKPAMTRKNSGQAKNMFTAQGGQANFNGRHYSDAHKESGIEWSDKHLMVYLQDPRGYLPGTKMQFCGIPSLSDRADLIQYLKQVTMLTSKSEATSSSR